MLHRSSGVTRPLVAGVLLLLLLGSHDEFGSIEKRRPPKVTRDDPRARGHCTHQRLRTIIGAGRRSPPSILSRHVCGELPGHAVLQAGARISVF